jgi:hypothetical protein
LAAVAGQINGIQVYNKQPSAVVAGAGRDAFQNEICSMAARAAHWRDLHFPNHTFGSAEAGGRYELVSAELAAESSDSMSSDIGQAPQLLRQGGVTRIILVHGTFAGNDIVGLVRQVARFSPSLAGKMNELGKRWFDELAGEVGNYTANFADCLSSLINPPSLPPIPVTRFEWSGENHHLGRAGGVMSLVESQTSKRGGERVLVLAHSHGGNVLAMLSHLVGSSQRDQTAFFNGTRLHYRNPLTGEIDLPKWAHARQRLADATQHTPRIDVATFGTPLRYRWNTDVCANLLHFVQHRPLDQQHPEVAMLPTSIQQVMDAAGGDYVQQLGIAGTDFVTVGFAWREWIVERRMRRMFEPRVRRRDLIKNLMRGHRVSADGTTLLVDYADTAEGWQRKLFGHGVYTCHQWLPFHLREITERFYGTPGVGDS